MKQSAGLLIRVPDGRALFLLRTGSNKFNGGTWCLPGGKCEPGEAPDVAAVRETREETGWVPESVPREVMRAQFYDVEYVTFEMKTNSPFIPDLSNGEHDGYSWAPLGSPPQPLHPGLAEALPRLRKMAGDTALLGDPLDWGADLDDLPVDSDHDGPWLSCMARDGRCMYRNCNVPSVASIGGRLYSVDDILKEHEAPEWVAIQKALAEYRGRTGREPDDAEREEIYQVAHEQHGTPGERAYCEAQGIPWDEWSAWCRGQEAKVEGLKPENPPVDADVRPVPHGHGELEAADKAFVESEHPRGQPGNAGQFGSGGSKSSGHAAGHRKNAPESSLRAGHEGTKVVDGVRVTASGAQLPEHIQKLKVPPAWTDVTFAADPKAALQVTGRDSKGRRQAVYSLEHQEKQAAAKFARVAEMDREYRAMVAQNDEARQSTDPRTRDTADCLDLVMRMGVRPGSDEDTGAEKRAYGATTLEGRHVSVSPDGEVRLKFVGKKGVDLDLPVRDASLARMLVGRAHAAGTDGKLFPGTDAGALLAHVHTLDGGGFKTKDFRTHVGTSEALRLVAAAPAPKNEKDYKKAVMSVAKQVSQVLGNTPTIALQSYISPVVFAAWRGGIGESAVIAEKRAAA